MRVESSIDFFGHRQSSVNDSFRFRPTFREHRGLQILNRHTAIGCGFGNNGIYGRLKPR